MMDFLKKSVLLFLAVILWNCDDNATRNGAIIDFVPEDVTTVIKISELPNSEGGFITFRLDVKNNDFLAALSKESTFAGLSEKTPILKYLNPTTNSLICISTKTDASPVYTFITKQTPLLFVADSIKDKTIETLEYNKKTIQRITIDNQTAFTSSKDSVFIASNSQQQLQDILDGKTQKDPEFSKLYQIESRGDFSVISKGKKVILNDSTAVNFASWTGVDISVLSGGIAATGVAMARDTIPQLLSVFQGQIPQKNTIANISPTDAKKLLSFTFSDAEKFQKSMQQFRGVTNNEPFSGLFGAINEVGEISLESGKAIVLSSIDPTLTEEALARFISEKNDYREVRISSFAASEVFSTAFSPFIQNINPKLSFSLDNFFVFTETEEVAQQLITAYKNGDVISKTAYYEKNIAELSDASSLLLIKLQGDVPTTISDFFTNASGFQLKSHPISALQYSYDRDFAHVNFVSLETTKKAQAQGVVSEVFSVKLNEKLLGTPQFFSNHRNGNKDVVVRDIGNTLHFISSSGKTLWKKKLDGPILGKIQEIDALRNGKKQLVFATSSTFYVLDRTGKPVSPFPIKFKDPITQPLSIFDYDNNRKYRFLITQGKEVFMYDVNGKIVKGFTFKKADSPIVLSPQHIRLGNKDYIAIAEENGKLNLLSRVGKSRITVKSKFEFSDNPIAKEGSNFVVITKDNIKESISQSGKVSTQKPEVSGSYYFVINGSTKVTLDDNLLRINGKLTELPFGVYNQPQVFSVNRTTYVSVSETQENKIYLYNKGGELISGFPIYGTSQADLDAPSTGKTVLLAFKGGDDEILVYGFSKN
ncbi:hypothetical protein [Ulvibacter antarcticus]|uniref:Uncharacterized protein n=1 Tax=Ulvibacter antarcticus TaxID=442714 RepID=A0A3L9YH06_9FLAO|nr:hypothetical protein [Ulvibacter antarcticus]RMA57168.1 hypothetical protein BXY75_3055 [Ulvibacter antarcticus]